MVKRVLLLVLAVLFASLFISEPARAMTNQDIAQVTVDALASSGYSTSVLVQDFDNNGERDLIVVYQGGKSGTQGELLATISGIVISLGNKYGIRFDIVVMTNRDTSIIWGAQCQTLYSCTSVECIITAWSKLK